MGLGGIPFPAEYGGGGADYATYALVLEELAVAGGALAGTLSVHGLPQLILSRFGTEEQKRRYLPRLAGGELLGAFALTEPETGSDAAAIATRAAADGDGFLISGNKAWITHSTVADLFVVFARTGEKEISAFLVEKTAPGLTPLPPEKKMGLRRSPTGGLSLAGVRVPAGALVGRPGDGLGIALTALDSGRITIGALAVGLCRGALDAALGYVRTRKAFGRPLEKNDVVRARLAEMAARTEAAAALVREAARLRDSDRPFYGRGRGGEARRHRHGSLRDRRGGPALRGDRRFRGVPRHPPLQRREDRADRRRRQRRATDGPGAGAPDLRSAGKESRCAGSCSTIRSSSTGSSNAR